MIKNSRLNFGWLSIGLHWLCAGLVVLVFSLGLNVSELDYYDSNYRALSEWHKGFGFVFFILVLLRICWRLGNCLPEFESIIPAWQRMVALAFQYAAYFLMVVIPLSGYFIVSGKGHGVLIFNWVAVPSVMSFDDRSDVCGKLHTLLSWSLIILSSFHAFASLKHHFIDKDSTLLKMLGISIKGEKI